MTSVSIITVCLNSDFSLFETFLSLQCIINSEKRDIEWIVIDGGSTDFSALFLSWISSLKYSNINIIQEPDGGIYDAMNKGVSLASKQFILFLNSGDLLEPKSMIGFIKSRQDINSIHVFGYVVRFRDTFRIAPPSFGRVCLQYLLSMYSLCLPSSHNSIIYPTHLLASVGFDTSLCCAADYLQYCVLRSNGFKSTCNILTPLTVISNDGFIASRVAISYRQYLSASLSQKHFLSSLYWRLRIFLLLHFK